MLQIVRVVTISRADRGVRLLYGEAVLDIRRSVLEATYNWVDEQATLPSIEDTDTWAECRAESMRCGTHAAILLSLCGIRQLCGRVAMTRRETQVIDP